MNYFLVILKMLNLIFMCGCFDLYQLLFQFKNVDNVVEIQVYLDNDRNVVVFKLCVVIFDGIEVVSEVEDLFGGFGGWLY